ncbi:uncharacterized protein LOC132054313 [Lycium ferocissimum]|uniref:uncharacterized protein LOC132054313 n=1 Tax=Lycium ferocissimum TaxID=112874 RepID=UPI00281610E2|nr:uncharacterized protein LOC132054313 [Lycium ferocissimum]
MRSCKKQFADASGSVGVCALCLRERLFVFVAAEAQAQTHTYYKQFQAIEPERMPLDMVFSGEIEVKAKPHLSNVASFCKSRSRKLADFTRFNPNR